MRSSFLFISFFGLVVGVQSQDEHAPVLPELLIRLSSSDEKHPTGDHYWWQESYGNLEFSEKLPESDIAQRVNYLRSDEKITFFSSVSFKDETVETALASADGAFEGSWCSGRVVFASLVSPQVDENGELLSEWEIPFYGLNGKLLSSGSRDDILKSLQGSVHFPNGSNFASIAFEPGRLEFSYVVSQLSIEESKFPWTLEAFGCFNAENRMASHSAHSTKHESSAIGEAEMFLWHGAPVRLSWDLRSNGDLTSEPFLPAIGEGFRVGSTSVQVSAIEPGTFGGGDVVSEKGRHKIEFTKRSDRGWTCFLGSNLPGSKVRRVEYFDSDGEWKDASVAAEDFGVISVDLPDADSAEDLPRIRIVWAPRTLRVIADIPSIGGGLPENEGVTTYNEIGFPLFGNPIDSNGIRWRLFHFLGFEFKHPGGETNQPDVRLPTDVDRLYKLADLVTAWEQLNPGSILRIDAEEKLITFEKAE